MSLQRNHKSLKENSVLFPPRVDTIETSLVYVQRTLAVCVSAITYLRGIFPEKTYRTRKWNNIPLRILKGVKEATTLINYMAGLFDALEKTYLRQIILGVCSNKNNLDDVIEAYTFTVNYDKYGSASLNVNGVTKKASFDSENSKDYEMYEQVTNETVCLLRRLMFFVETLEPLPVGCVLTMKLLYYDDRTPVDYEPPGFQPCREMDFTFGGQKPVAVKLGQLQTGFHSLKTDIRTVVLVKNKSIRGFNNENTSLLNKHENNANDLPIRYSVADSGRTSASSPIAFSVAQPSGKRTADNCEFNDSENEISSM